MSNILDILIVSNLYLILFVLFVFTLVASISLLLLEHRFNWKYIKNDIMDVDLEKESYDLKSTFLMCIAGPYVETLIFQTLIFKISMLIIKDTMTSVSIGLILSTTLFSLAHLILGDKYDAIRRFPLGFSLAFLYLYAVVNDYSMSPTGIVFLFHAFWNTMLVLLVPLATFIEIVIGKLKN